MTCSQDHPCYPRLFYTICLPRCHSSAWEMLKRSRTHVTNIGFRKWLRCCERLLTLHLYQYPKKRSTSEYSVLQHRASLWAVVICYHTFLGRPDCSYGLLQSGDACSIEAHRGVRAVLERAKGLPLIMMVAEMLFST